MKIKTGDNVIVLIGKDKNRQGQVLKVLTQKKKAIVKGVNISKKHVKSTQNKPGGIIDREMPIFLSKLALVCPLCKKPTRVGYTIDSTGKKDRICRKCLGLIDTKKIVKKTAPSKAKPKK